MTDSSYNSRDNAKTRKEKACSRLQEKVAILEKWSTEGVPEGYVSHPKNIGAFNEWQDEELTEEVHIEGMERSVKGVFNLSTMTTNKYPELKERAIAAMKKIASAPKLKDEIAKIMAENSILKKTRTELGNQIVELRIEIAEISKKYSDINKKYCRLIERNKK